MTNPRIPTGSFARIALSLSLFGAVAVACSSKPADTASTTPPQSNASASSGGSAATVAPTGVTRNRVSSPTPGTIAAMAEFGENAYDAATASSWAKASAISDSLAAGERTLPTPNSDIDSTVQSLKSAIARKDRPAARHYANAITRLATEMSAHYTDPTPSDVAMLDYYGREIELGAAANDIAVLKQTTSNIDATWARVRPQVESHGGAAVARKFGDTVTRLDAATTAAEYGKLATTILAQVDDLEKVFVK